MLKGGIEMKFKKLLKGASTVWELSRTTLDKKKIVSYVKGVNPLYVPFVEKILNDVDENSDGKLSMIEIAKYLVEKFKKD